jgi:hypothetical protein
MVLGGPVSRLLIGDPSLPRSNPLLLWIELFFYFLMVGENTDQGQIS